MRKSNRKLKNYLLSAMLAASASPAFAAGGFTVMYGTKSLDKDKWRPVDTQQEAGFILEFQGTDWPVTVIANYLESEGSATGYGPGITATVKGSTTEVGLGIRKYLSKNRIRYFVEAGLMRVTADLSIQATGFYSVAASATDTGTGFWYGVGTNTLLSDTWSIGILGRVSTANIMFDGLNVDAGGKHFSFTVTHYFD